MVTGDIRPAIKNEPVFETHSKTEKKQTVKKKVLMMVLWVWLHYMQTVVCHVYCCVTSLHVHVLRCVHAVCEGYYTVHR